MVHGSTRIGTCQVKLLCGIRSNGCCGVYVSGNVEDRTRKVFLPAGKKPQGSSCASCLTEGTFRQQLLFRPRAHAATPFPR